MQPNRRPESRGRLLAKVVWELLKTERFETLADLTDALKCRCAHLRIAWTDDDINDAFRLIESNTPLLATLVPRPTNPKHIERGPEGFDPPKDVAREMIDQLRKKLGAPPPIKTMPRVELISQREADRRTALEMVAREMHASIARCEALEKETASDES